MEVDEKQAVINCKYRRSKRQVKVKYKNYRKAVLKYCDSCKNSDKKQIATSLLELVEAAYKAYNQLYDQHQGTIIFNEFLKRRKHEN